MDLLTLASLSGLAKTVEWLLTDDANGVGRFGAAVFTGVLGNRADTLVCRVLGSASDYFNRLRTTDSNLSHDLEWAAQKAYLVATQEMARQAVVRMEANPAWKIWRPAVDRIRAGIKRDLDDKGKTLSVRISDIELWLLDERKQPADRMQRLRTAMEKKLRADICERWTDGEVPTVIEDLLRTGWQIDTKRIKNVDRDWHGLIAIAFMEELKRSTSLSDLFQSKVLVEMANREPELEPIASFAGFQAALDRVLLPLQEIEDSLGVLHSKVDAIVLGVGEVKAELQKISGILGWWARLPRTAQGVIGFLLLVGVLWGAVRFGREVGCQIPIFRGGMERWETGDRVLPLVVRLQLEPMPTEAEAQADAVERAKADAAEACQGYNTGVYRLQRATAVPREWHCIKRANGVTCGFDGTVMCRVLLRTGGCEL